MSTLQKFDGTLDELGAEVEKLKSVSAVYQKIEGLATANAEVNRKFDAARQELGKINEAHLANKAALEKSLDNLATAQAQGQKDLAKQIDNKIEELRKQNKEFYKDLEDTMRIKLDDNKREIKSLIENERLQLKEIITNELATRTREIREAMEAESGKQTGVLMASEKQTRMMVMVFGGISVAMGLGVLVKVLVG
jgi:DNA repair exonuclease SbcCD ATPase subunit